MYIRICLKTSPSFFSLRSGALWQAVGGRFLCIIVVGHSAEARDYNSFLDGLLPACVCAGVAPPRQRLCWIWLSLNLILHLPIRAVGPCSSPSALCRRRRRHRSLAVIVFVLRIWTLVFIFLSLGIFCVCYFFSPRVASLSGVCFGASTHRARSGRSSLILCLSLFRYFSFLRIFLHSVGFARGLRRFTWSDAPPVAAQHLLPPRSLLSTLPRPLPPTASLPPFMNDPPPYQVMLAGKSSRRRGRKTSSILPPSIPPSLIFFG